MTRIRCIAPALRIASGVLLLVSTAAAQETSPLLSKKLSPAAEAAIRERVEAVHANFRQKNGRDPSYYGLVCCQILQIPAAAFNGMRSFDEADFTAPLYIQASSGSLFWAPVQLPTGANIQFLNLYYFDLDPVEFVTASLWAAKGGGVLSGPPDTDVIAIVTSDGLPDGYGYASSGIVELHRE